MANEKILLIEDEEAIRELVVITLGAEGYNRVDTAGNGEDGLRLARFGKPDLIILDLMLPGIDGLTVCRRLKDDETTRLIPIIMLTARSEESDIVLGLEMGANDYITKPFSRKVLIARIRTQLRMLSGQAESHEIRYSGLTVNSEQYSARLHGAELDLTRSEFEILKMLASHPGRVYTRNQIINQVKGDEFSVTARAVDVQIVNLRKKLGGWGKHIETVRGIGYRMKPEVSL